MEAGGGLVRGPPKDRPSVTCDESLSVAEMRERNDLLSGVRPQTGACRHELLVFYEFWMPDRILR